MEFSHINASGEANMVDVGAQLSERSATASGIIEGYTLQAIKTMALRKESPR